MSSRNWKTVLPVVSALAHQTFVVSVEAAAGLKSKRLVSAEKLLRV